MEHILVLNAGSSSLKFAVFDRAAEACTREGSFKTWTHPKPAFL